MASGWAGTAMGGIDIRVGGTETDWHRDGGRCHSNGVTAGWGWHSNGGHRRGDGWRWDGAAPRWGMLAWRWVTTGRRGATTVGVHHPTTPPPTPFPPQRFAAAVQRHVELLVVADAAMARFHGTELRPYLLTVLATAARTFRHGSLGAAVQLRLTRLLVLANGAPGPSVTSNAAQTLRDFCRWQRDLNVPDEDSPLHFDVAVLFTRQVGGNGGGWGLDGATVLAVGFLGRWLGPPNPVPMSWVLGRTPETPTKAFGCWLGCP